MADFELPAPTTRAAPARVAGPRGLAARLDRYALDVCERSDPGRATLESFVRDAFARKHGAHVATFMPTLVALRDRADRVCGVAGFRAAAQERLYLEHYLDVPVERAIGAAAGCTVARAGVVEVGNLAAGSCRSARYLAAQLPRVLLAAQFEWLVFTGTRVVREILEGFDAPLHDLGPADGARLPDVADDWGAYYDADPRVMAGFLPHAHVLAAFSGGLDH